MILPIIYVSLLLLALVVLKPVYWGYIITLLILVNVVYSTNIKIIYYILPVVVERYGRPTNSLQLRSKILPVLKNVFILLYNFMKLPKGRTVFVANPPQTSFDRLLPVLIPRDIKVIGYSTVVPRVSIEEVEKEKDCSFVSYNIEEAMEVAKRLKLSVTPIVFDSLETDDIGRVKEYVLRIMVGETGCSERQIKTFLYRSIRYCRNHKKLEGDTRFECVKKVLKVIFAKKKK